MRYVLYTSMHGSQLIKSSRMNGIKSVSVENWKKNHVKKATEHDEIERKYGMDSEKRLVYRDILVDHPTAVYIFKS